MQYDQCLTRGTDNSAVIITHCDMNQNTEWKYFKVHVKHYIHTWHNIIVLYKSLSQNNWIKKN